MPTYKVINKVSGAEATRYDSAAMALLDQYPLVTFDHVEFVADEPVPTPTGPRVMTKLEYLRRFTQAERIAIRTAATQSPVLNDYLQLLELAEEINTGDADTIAAVTMLEQAGLLAAGRGEVILNA